MSEVLKTKFGNAKIDKNGYYQITSRKEGNHGKMLHRLIFEDFYQTKIPEGWIIHHEDSNRTNNEIWNLILMPSEEHTILHHKGKIMSDETKQKLSDSMKGENHPNYGKHLPKETREKISQSNTGHFVSDETKKKISKSNTGKKHSDNSTEKMSKIKTTTGYYRVSIHHNKNYKKGYGYRYQWYDEKGKRKKIESARLSNLKKKVVGRGLKWLKLIDGEWVEC